jgi:probable F420-dependent oxidoreductase
MDDPDDADAAADGEHIAEFARVTEQSGFDAIAFTEHPAPSDEWLYGPYGHGALDPFSALAFCASVTTRLRLMTYLAVLPYRHPLLTVKAATTVDCLSRGRLVLGVGTGYLRAEFDALGVPFGERSDLLEHALAALHAAWADGFPGTGRPAEGRPPSVLRPRPVQRPRPPIWIGGNSRRARYNAARYGDGWAPLLVQADTAGELGTQRLGSLSQFRDGVADLRRLLADEGRQPRSVTVNVKGSFSRVTEDQVGGDEHIAQLAALAEAGADSVVIHPMASGRERILDVLRRYGDEVIAKFTTYSAA